MRPARHREVGRSGVVLALAALVVAGCSKSASDQAKQGLESLHSWAVSARMVGERWVEGAVPVPYASKTLQSFGEKVRKERGKTASGELPSKVKRFLVAGFDSTANATDSLLAVVNRGDKRAAADVIRRFSMQARSVDSVKASLGAK